MAQKLKVKTIDGSKNKNEINNEILIELLQKYYSHFWTFYRWMFFSNPSQLNKKL